jgi:hypothetical protein
MWVVSRSKSIVSALLAIVVLGIGTMSRAADEAAPGTFVALKFEGACDGQNNRLWLSNTHTFKTVVTKVRWKAAGGKDLTEDFYPAPNSMRELGCAAEAEILEAKFAEF